MKISLATNWDDDLINKISSLDIKKRKIEFFGAKKKGVIMSGRYSTLKRVSAKRIEKHLKLIKNEGFSFNYLINSPNDISQLSHKLIDDYLRWIIHIGSDSVTVSNMYLLHYLAENHPHIQVKISTIMGVDSVKKMKVLKRYPNIHWICLSESVNRNKKLLQELIAVAHDVSIGNYFGVELWANTTCILNCPERQEHYRVVSSAGAEAFKRCRKGKSNLLNLAFIRPEDQALYKTLGVDSIKLSGRDKSTPFLHRALTAYLSKSYVGNIFDILDSRKLMKTKYLHNKKLNGFISYMFRNNFIEIKGCEFLV